MKETVYLAGKAIEDILGAKRINYKAFAEAFGKSEKALQMMLYHKRKLFTEEELDDIAAYLSVPKRALMVNPTTDYNGRNVRINDTSWLWLLDKPIKKEEKPMFVDISNGIYSERVEVKPLSPSSGLRQVLDEEKAEWDELHRQVDILTEKLAIANKNIEGLTETVERERKFSEEIQDENNGLRLSVSKFEADVCAAVEKSERYKAAYENESAELKMATERVTNLENEISLMKEQMFNLLKFYYERTK